MRSVRFEEADNAERMQIGEGLTRPAVAIRRLETSRVEEKYFLRYDNGCAVRGKSAEAGSPLCLDSDADEIFCEEHGWARRES